MRILVTGGMGFIGSALVRHLITDTSHAVVNVDKLTYAANPDAVEAVTASPRYVFARGDIADAERMREIFRRHPPDIVINLAAESHVDRSIDAPMAFSRTNILGTQTLLDVALTHWHHLPAASRAAFRFHQVSTDEVYGSMPAGYLASEDTPYAPNSPYAASKAAADHLVRAWNRTYGLPTVITNCSNCYGPWQFPEKLIPLMVTKALSGEALPVYGTGENRRDWLHVDDHVRALVLAATRAEPGSHYNIGASGPLRNLDVVRAICSSLDELEPRADGHGYANQITFVVDRPGHDLRYAVDPARIRTDLGWQPEHGFDAGLHETVRWYLGQGTWWRDIRTNRYAGERLGQAAS
ncbi:dTDP-glucose 4,6-dehydratase [Limimonas halophila]|uniref:dTDP-glucose 4,6-dehydratase n=1 Tax=Limimonas halophila TaxID=1082479 RepID=A0A1G7NRC7_9PROT|nr:dTDP-glucose 4,6-dehydratase [Limimonas halophila]SDF76604.1 dTDP-glucose 4,6-dehydratase [Limimonas halophila]